MVKLVGMHLDFFVGVWGVVGCCEVAESFEEPLKWWKEASELAEVFFC